MYKNKQILSYNTQNGRDATKGYGVFMDERTSEVPGEPNHWIVSLECESRGPSESSQSIEAKCAVVGFTKLRDEFDCTIRRYTHDHNDYTAKVILINY